MIIVVSFILLWVFVVAMAGLWLLHEVNAIHRQRAEKLKQREEDYRKFLS